MNYKIFNVFAFAVIMMLGLSCSDDDKPVSINNTQSPENTDKELILSVIDAKDNYVIGDQISFKVDEDGKDLTSESTIEVDGTPIDGNIFKIEAAGRYTFVAKDKTGKKKSNEITIEAKGLVLKVDKTRVRPGDTVTFTVLFGEENVTDNATIFIDGKALNKGVSTFKISENRLVDTFIMVYATINNNRLSTDFIQIDIKESVGVVAGNNVVRYKAYTSTGIKQVSYDIEKVQVSVEGSKMYGENQGKAYIYELDGKEYTRWSYRFEYYVPLGGSVADHCSVVLYIPIKNENGNKTIVLPGETTDAVIYSINNVMPSVSGTRLPDIHYSQPSGAKLEIASLNVGEIKLQSAVKKGAYKQDCKTSFTAYLTTVAQELVQGGAYNVIDAELSISWDEAQMSELLFSGFGDVGTSGFIDLPLFDIKED